MKIGKYKLSRPIRLVQSVAIIVLNVMILSLFAGCTPSYKEVNQENGEMWIYLNGLYFEDEEKEVTLNFPDSWKDDFIIVENDHALIVCLREVKEKHPDIYIGAGLFIILSIDKNDDVMVNMLGNDETYYGETDTRVFYLEVSGEINPFEVDSLDEYSDMGIVTVGSKSPLYEEQRENFCEIVKGIVSINNR